MNAHVATLARSLPVRQSAVAIGCALGAVILGLAAGMEFGPLVWAGLAVGGVGIFLTLAAKPKASLVALASQTVFFLVLPLTEGRGINPIDILLPAAVLGAWFWFEDRRADGAHAAEVERARRGIVHAAYAYYGVAILSLVALSFQGRVMDALDSLLILSRSFEGALFFYLVGRLARTRSDLHRVRDGVLGGITIAFVLNAPSMLLFDIPRAGAVWAFGQTMARSGASWSIGPGGMVVTNPNELAMGCLLTWALLLAMPLRSKLLNVLFLSASFVLLMLTLSRAGLLGWLILLALYGVRGGQRWVWLLPLSLAALFPLLPEEFTTRMLRTATMQRGSFEAYTTLIRVYCWESAFATFLAHPILGVGYLGFRFVSADFNPLGLKVQTAESYYIEIASGMGVIGLLTLVAMTIAVIRASSTLRRVSQPGSIADRFGRVGPAYLAALGISNLTGDLLIGLLCVSQLALFLGMGTQAARLEDCRTVPS